MGTNRDAHLFETIFTRDEGRCVYCGVPVLRRRRGLHRASDLATLDHVVPKSQGGALTADNVVLARQACNNARGTLDAAAFRSLTRRAAKKKAPRGSL